MKINISNFGNDLAVGKNKELMLLEKIRKKYPNAYLEDDNRYDIYVPETGDSIEVKYDLLSKDTGNYFIETAFDDEPSGITATEANWYVLVDKENIVWIKTETLKYLLKGKREFLFQGEGHVVKGKLLVKNELLFSNYAIVHST